MLLLGVSQEVAKKETKAFPLGSPAALPQGIRRRVAPSGCLCRQVSGLDFCHSVLFEIRANTGALQVAKTFIFARYERLPCPRFTIKTRAQGLNMLTFAQI
jgi:hypothetical protein